MLYLKVAQLYSYLQYFPMINKQHRIADSLKKKILNVGISIKPKHKLPVSRMLLTKIMTLNNFLAIVCLVMLFSIELKEGKT